MLNFINSSWTFAYSYLFESSNGCEHAKRTCAENGKFSRDKNRKNQ